MFNSLEYLRYKKRIKLLIASWKQLIVNTIITGRLVVSGYKLLGCNRFRNYLQNCQQSQHKEETMKEHRIIWLSASVPF